ncbi:hypothetical protein [Bradyrhizobium sp. STM 3561]|uniref:hypothetical protein n=1 Tax=Bradyrhizobium sp. STM 3561 TaxID=578923 RepID=UPI0038905609
MEPNGKFVAPHNCVAGSNQDQKTDYPLKFNSAWSNNTRPASTEVRFKRGVSHGRKLTLLAALANMTGAQGHFSSLAIFSNPVVDPPQSRAYNCHFYRG